MEKQVKGWKNIAAYFPYHTDVVKRKFGREMLESGAVFKSHIGKGKEVLVWSFPSLIKAYIVLRQIKYGKV